MCLFIFTDGACKRDGDGGWAFVAVSNQQEVHRASGKAVGVTNNRMELYAILMAMGWAYSQGVDNVIIVTDSRYAISVIGDTQKANCFPGHKINDDLIKQARTLRSHMGDIKFEWVKGHSGNEWNEFADRLATAARAGVPAHELHKPRKAPTALAAPIPANVTCGSV